VWLQRRWCFRFAMLISPQGARAASWKASCPWVGSSDRPAFGFQVVESIPALGKAPPFAGRRRNAGLGRCMRATGASSSPPEVPMTERDARSAFRGGELHPRRGRQPAADFDEALRSGLIGLHVPKSPFNAHRRKRWSGRVAARKQSRVREEAFGVLFGSCVLLQGSSGLGGSSCSSQRSLPAIGGAFFDGGRCSRSA
jgi:hypothetical protein